jgi:hypothetical protein
MSDFSSPHRANPDFSLDQFLMSVFGPVVNDLITHVGNLRRNIDVESVHQARVATRKVRSQLKTFAPLLKKKKCEVIAEELKWLNAKITPTRDIDVLIEIAQKVEIENQDTAHKVNQSLFQERNASIHSLANALEKKRVDALLTQLVHFALHPPIKKKLLASPVHVRKTSAVQCISNTWTLLFTEVERLPKHPRPKQLHRVGIMSKRCRYAYEVAEIDQLLPSAHITTYAQNLQGKLGHLNDNALFLRWLKKQPYASTSLIKKVRTELQLPQSVGRKQLISEAT